MKQLFKGNLCIFFLWNIFFISIIIICNASENNDTARHCFTPSAHI